MQRRIISEFSHSKRVRGQLNAILFFASRRSLTLGGEAVADDPPYEDVPRPCRRKSERKPYPTPMKILIRRAKEERKARKAQPCRVLEEIPDNGLLVPELVGVAHQVYRAHQSLLHGLRKLIDVIPVQRCWYYLVIFPQPLNRISLVQFVCFFLLWDILSCFVSNAYNSGILVLCKFRSFGCDSRSSLCCHC